LLTLLTGCLVAVFTTAGCDAPRTSGTRTSRENPPATAVKETTPTLAANTTDPGKPADGLRQEPVIILQVNFDILRIRVPKGVFSESGKIWNHLDEGTIPAETTKLLQRNGLRAARGKPDSWPPIKALLEPVKVETSRSDMTLLNGLPLFVEIDRRQRDQTLFLYRRDGTLGGVTCPQSSNFIRIEYAIPLADPSAVEVEVMPEIRQQQTLTPLRLNELGQLEQAFHEPTRVLRELAFHMELPAGEFMVIGPAAAAHPGHLAGSLLLCEVIDGRPYESMYFITPRVYRTDRSRRP